MKVHVDEFQSVSGLDFGSTSLKAPAY
jgi:hypothetical protein